jgi:hypothetical protein
MTRTRLTADVAVIGGGLGGIAAALAAADAGRSVVLTAAESMIGGQVTSQLTAPLDEHPLVESAGVTATYRRFRDLVRAACGGAANPGEGWVSRLCFEPLVGLDVLEGMLEENLAAGRIRLFTGHTPVRAVLSAGVDPRIEAVELEGPGGSLLELSAGVFIDATETGDLLPLTGTAWVIGSEGTDAYDEPDAVPGPADPRAEQSFTWVAAVVREPEPLPVGPAPEDYARLRDSQPFSLDLDGWDGATHRYRFFRDGPDGKPPFWEYRRVRTAASGQPEAAVINWAGNDYSTRGLVADPERATREARNLTLAFVHWLRTEVPRDTEDGPGPLGTGRGYPELRLAPELSGTPDGLAAAPYVRESRRLANPDPVTFYDLVAGPDGLARPFPDSVGIAWYHADLHPRVGHSRSVFSETAPFFIPARALVPAAGVGPANLVMGAKNLAATQVAAAAYRLQPGEWAIGEAAGVIAAAAVAAAASAVTGSAAGQSVDPPTGTGTPAGTGTLTDTETPAGAGMPADPGTPTGTGRGGPTARAASARGVVRDPGRLRAVQDALTARGAPIAWPENAVVRPTAPPTASLPAVPSLVPSSTEIPSA